MLFHFFIQEGYPVTIFVLLGVSHDFVVHLDIFGGSDKNFQHNFFSRPKNIDLLKNFRFQRSQKKLPQSVICPAPCVVRRYARCFHAGMRFTWIGCFRGEGTLPPPHII